MTGDVDQLDRMKVFVSYSRADVSFADQLMIALESQGFDAILDRHDIDAAENWKARLGSLILSCDAVAFVLTEKSAGSPICAWEVDEAKKLGKRIVPCVPGEVSAAAPAALADLNWIHFYSTPAIPGSGMFDGLAKLVRALKIDLAWLREQTRLSERAAEWRLAQAEDRLLRGAALKEAQDWLGRAPKDASVPASVRDYLAASADAEQGRETAAKAQLEEREQALKAAEAAVADKEKLQRSRQRILAFGGLLALALSAAALVGGWFAATNYVDANEKRGALFAQAADELSTAGQQEKAMLMALYGDPSGEGAFVNAVLRPGGFERPRQALIRSYTHARLAAAPETGIERIEAAALFPDGKRVAVAGEYGPVRVISTEGKPPVEFALEDGRARLVAVSPDGKKFAVVYYSNQVVVWPAAGGAALAKIGDEYSADVSETVFSPDSTKLAIGRYANGAEVWSADSASLLHKFEEHSAYSLAFTADGKFLLAGMEELQVWPLEGGTPCHFAGIKNVVSIAVSRDGRYFATGSPEGSLMMFEVGKMLFPCNATPTVVQTYHGPVGNSTYLAFSADGGALLAGYDNGPAKLWPTSRRAEVPMLEFGAPEDINLPSVQVSADGAVALTATKLGVRLWRMDLAAPAASRPYDGVPDRFFDGGAKLLTRSDNGAAIWPVKGGEPQVIALPGMKDINAIAVSADGASVFPAGQQGWGRVWSLKGEKLHEAKLTPRLTGWFEDVALTGDGRTAIFAGWEQIIGGANGAYLWRPGEKAAFAYFAEEGAANAVAASADGRRFAVGGFNADPKLLDAAGKLVAPLSGHRAAGLDFMITQIAFSADGKLVATAAHNRAFEFGDFSVQVASAEDGHSVARLVDRGEGFNALAFSADSQLLATTTARGLQIWSVKGGGPLQTLTPPGDLPLNQVAFAPGGKAVVAASQEVRGGRQKAIHTFVLDPILTAKASDQVRIACERLRQSGVMAFSEADYQSFPILDRNAPHPCAKVWGFDPRVKAAAAAKK